MAAQFFPNIEDIFDLIMSELPNGVYPQDRADDPDFDKRSFSSSELRAHAQTFSLIYNNLKSIYENKFASTVNIDGISQWEKDYFKFSQDASLSFEERRQKLIAKVRALGRLSLPYIDSVVGAILDPLGLPYDILPYSGQNNGNINGTWIFEESLLDLDTFLGALDPIIGAQQPNPLDCNLDYAAAGLTLQDLLDIQETAYKYEVRIFGNADANTLSLLDRTLTSVEPARSTHFIRNNAVESVDP